MLDTVLDWCCGSDTSLLVTITISITLLVLLVWLIGLTVITLRGYRYSNTLFGTTKRSDLKSILDTHLERVEEVQRNLTTIEEALRTLEAKSQFHIAKVGLVRFNPYDDTGGNQSFVLALLNEKDDGVVVSSLHGRNRTRTYAKPVRSGIGAGFELSTEEVEAIKKAQE